MMFKLAPHNITVITLLKYGMGGGGGGGGTPPPPRLGNDIDSVGWEKAARARRPARGRVKKQAVDAVNVLCGLMAASSVTSPQIAAAGGA